MVFGHIAGIALSVPDELKCDDQQIKRAPEIGEWWVISTSKISGSKVKQLSALGFRTLDMSKGAKPIGKVIADIMQGTYHGE